jgi:hypothetical protein
VIHGSYTNNLGIKSQASFRKQRRDFSKHRLNEHRGNPKEFWKTLRLVLPKKNKSTCINKLVVENKEIIDPKQIANALNSHFVGIGNSVLYCRFLTMGAQSGLTVVNRCQIRLKGFKIKQWEQYLERTEDLVHRICVTNLGLLTLYNRHTCPILRYATDGKNVLTIGKYEYRFFTCSTKRNMISLLGYLPMVCRGDTIHNLLSAVSKDS